MVKDKTDDRKVSAGYEFLTAVRNILIVKKTDATEEYPDFIRCIVLSQGPDCYKSLAFKGFSTEVGDHVLVRRGIGKKLGEGGEVISLPDEQIIAKNTDDNQLAFASKILRKSELKLNGFLKMQKIYNESNIDGS